MPRTKYLVVVHAPKPKGSGFPPMSQSQSYTVATPPSVQWITASSAQEAVGTAKVAPGGHALVAAEQDVERFDRAEQAPLERKRTDGNPLPMEAEAV